MSGCLKQVYVTLSVMSMQLRDMGEFGLLRAVDNRRVQLAYDLSPSEMKEAAIEIQNWTT